MGHALTEHMWPEQGLEGEFSMVCPGNGEQCEPGQAWCGIGLLAQTCFGDKCTGSGKKEETSKISPYEVCFLLEMWFGLKEAEF